MGGVITAHSRAPEHVWKQQKQRGAAAGSAMEKSRVGLAVMWWHWCAPSEACAAAAAAALAGRREQRARRGVPADFLPRVMLAGAVSCLKRGFLCWHPPAHAQTRPPPHAI